MNNVIFNILGTFLSTFVNDDEIYDGTKNASQITGINELFRLTNLEKGLLVREIDVRWNHIEPSILLMYDKLVKLGFVYYNGRIEIAEPKGEKNHV
jgi:hypothetical protein